MRGPERTNFDGVVTISNSRSSAPPHRPSFNDSDLMQIVGGAMSDLEGSTMGYDETGIRPRARDMNSGPEKGNFRQSIV